MCNQLCKIKKPRQIIDLQRGFKRFAEKEGFEPPVQSPGQRFSRPPQSTTLPFLPLHPLLTVGDGQQRVQI